MPVNGVLVRIQSRPLLVLVPVGSLSCLRFGVHCARPRVSPGGDRILLKRTYGLQVLKHVRILGSMSVTSIEAKRLLSRNIDAILQRKGWSRYRLAQESGITEATISNIMNETHEPRISVLVTLATAMGVSANRLIAGHREDSEKILAESA